MVYLSRFRQLILVALSYLLSLVTDESEPGWFDYEEFRSKWEEKWGKGHQKVITMRKNMIEAVEYNREKRPENVPVYIWQLLCDKGILGVLHRLERERIELAERLKETEEVRERTNGELYWIASGNVIGG